MKQPLSRGAYRLLKAIKSYDFRSRGWSCPGQDTLAKDLKVGERTIKRYVAELRAKNYLAVNRRPNSSSLYRFGVRSGQNVPTEGTENVPAGVPAGVPTIQLFLTGSNSSPVPTRKPPAKETSRMAQMPEYYKTSKDQKLWRMAQRWIHENKPDLAGYLDHAAPIMSLLEAAGALDLAEADPLPTIPWPPAKRPTLDTVRIQRPPSNLERELSAISVTSLRRMA